MKHVRELLPSISCHYVVCLTSGQQLIDNVKVIITSYSLLETHIEKLMSINFGIVIMDESHSLKSRDAKRTVVADRLAMKANRIILLSGTPALSRPVELFSQLKMLDRNFFKYNQYSNSFSTKNSRFEINILVSCKFLNTSDQILSGKTNEFRLGCFRTIEFIGIECNFKSKIYDKKSEIRCIAGFS